MNNSTEYCSFVSEDYIICECGESFSDEETLKIHLENDHSTVKSETTNSDTEVLENIIGVKNEVVEPDIAEEEYYVEDVPESGTLEYILPDDIKQENIIVQYVDEDQNAEEQVVIERHQSGVNTLACRQVVFSKETLGKQFVILDQENLEHDYDRGVPVPLKKEYFFCDVCGKAFAAERSLRLHKYMHTNKDDTKNSTSTRKRNNIPKERKQPKNSVCDVCGKKYNSNAALRYHQRVHTGEKPYPCPYCPKAFTMRLFQQIHVRTHTGERPYQCPHCPKAFGNKAALLRHDRVHTGVKPYGCPECGKTFTQSNSMKLHYQTVHLKMPAPYKSASRKLRAMQKAMGQSPAESLPHRDSVRKEKKNRKEKDAGTSNSKLIKDFEYVVEEVPFSDNEDYEDVPY